MVLKQCRGEYKSTEHSQVLLFIKLMHSILHLVPQNLQQLDKNLYVIYLTHYIFPRLGSTEMQQSMTEH